MCPAVRQLSSTMLTMYWVVQRLLAHFTLVGSQVRNHKGLASFVRMKLDSVMVGCWASIYDPFCEEHLA